jgi:hypothetical protein
MRKNMVKPVKKSKPSLLVLLVVLLAVQTLNAGGLSLTQTAPGQQAPPDVTAEAKRTLDKIGSLDLNRVKNGRMRAAIKRSISAVRSLASNTSKPREAALVANLARTVKDLKALQPKPATFEECDKGYEDCMELCKLTGGGNCDGCAGVNHLCYLMRLTIELVEGDL